MIDLALLQLLRHRDDYYRVKGRIPDSSLDPQTLSIVKDYGKYFDKFPEHDAVSIQTFLPMFRAWHPTLEKDQMAAYDAILNNARTTLNPTTRAGVLDSLLELRLGTDLAALLVKFDAGELPDIQGALDAALAEFRLDATGRAVDYVTDDIHDLLDEEIDNSGLHWRLDCLNRSMRGLRPGDFGIIAARPDQGKTTFIASEVTHLASQLTDGRTCVWLNNEGPGKRIIPRLYQAAIGGSIADLGVLRKGGMLKKAYARVMGDMDRIRIVNIHGLDAFTVEQIIERNNAGIVVYDMIDHIRGFGDQPRTDLQLEAMYKWAREISVKYGLIGIASSQISFEGEGVMFPPQSALKDSKTGKQGACDFILMIGASLDPNLGGVRYIGLPKNKLRRPGMPGDPRVTVNYDPERVRYSDIPVMLTEDTSDGEQTTS